MLAGFVLDAISLVRYSWSYPVFQYSHSSHRREPERRGAKAAPKGSPNRLFRSNPSCEIYHRSGLWVALMILLVYIYIVLSVRILRGFDTPLVNYCFSHTISLLYLQ